MKTTDLACAAVVVSMAAALSACGTGDGTSPAAHVSSPSSRPASAGPSSPSVQDHAEFCSHLNLFAVVAGPSFELALLDFAADKSSRKRKAVVSDVHVMASDGPLLLGQVPPKVETALRKVIHAATKAESKLEGGASPIKAVTGLTTDKVSAARKTVSQYRGSC